MSRVILKVGSSSAIFADRVAHLQVLDLGEGDDVAGDGLGHGFLRLALHDEQAAGARRLAGAGVDDRLLGRDLARDDLDEAQVADELVVERLEHFADELRRLAGFEDDLLLPLPGHARQALHGYTTAPALTASAGHLNGRIAPGYRADLTAFAASPLYTPAADLPDVPITLTTVDGTIRHRAS